MSMGELKEKVNKIIDNRLEKGKTIDWGTKKKSGKIDWLRKTMDEISSLRGEKNGRISIFSIVRNDRYD